MKRWLRRVVIGAALIAVAVGTSFEGVTRVGRGRLYGEPFYEGRPASYWAIEIERWETQDPTWGTQTYKRRPTWPRWVERMIPEPCWPRLLDGDPDGLAVLQALRKHPSSEVQNWGRIGIERIDNGERGPCKIYHPSVIVTAQLYEVDETFHKEVAKGKWLSMADFEKLERIFLGLDPPEKMHTGESSLDLLGKQKPLLAAKEIKIENNQEGSLLSSTKEINCLPSPAQLRKGQTGPQMIEEGMTLRARVQVSFDRRFVRMTFIEKGAQLEGIDKVSVVLDEKGAQAVAEVAFLKESTFSTMRNLPDGGTLLLPLQYRRGSANEKERWLVARIEPRIYIAAEERRIRGEPDK
jgi:hypothetical protein